MRFGKMPSLAVLSLLLAGCGGGTSNNSSPVSAPASSRELPTTDRRDVPASDVAASPTINTNKPGAPRTKP